MPRALAAHAVA